MGGHGVRRARRDRARAGRLGMVIGTLGAASALGFATVGGVAAAHPASPPALVPGTPCTVVARACVDRAEGVAWLIDDGVVTFGPVLVSTGAAEEETPTGTYRVEWKNLHHISGESGVPMPFSVFFAPGGIAFHQGSIYTESAGCVRMRRDDARRFY
ncbi:MAG: L,D-transpeptidase, partial [Pseudonocardia sp.]